MDFAPTLGTDLRNRGDDGSDQNINRSIDNLIDSSLSETFLQLTCSSRVEQMDHHRWSPPIALGVLLMAALA
jgi:hypothetical protein